MFLDNSEDYEPRMNCIVRDEFLRHLRNNFINRTTPENDDNIQEEREMGINAGKKLIEALPGIVTVVYQDLGISKGMQYGIDRAKEKGRTIEYRFLGDGWKENQIKLVKKHNDLTIVLLNNFLCT